ncbi:MAG: hypothetical protein KDJ28_03700 [Candidatus Competibacteraceae bacterium]|nr:hypothetical protein [Candidatus Competibacteraceae bacterium]
MNLKHYLVLFASTIILLFSLWLFDYLFENANYIISELSWLYYFGAIAGCGLATIGFMTEFVGDKASRELSKTVLAYAPFCYFLNYVTITI